jgi:hypothetical protein
MSKSKILKEKNVETIYLEDQEKDMDKDEGEDESQ